ncbi:MAG TPA: response regulator [Ramlibacter sp.]|jgi:DNA-binding NarL/FixJ family response regulator|nr:response regulator [Ramlibacter sp.]
MKARVLLVEDNPLLQLELADSLGAMFEVVAIKATADEAIAWLHAQPDGWDLAVVDIFLRQGHGFDVLRQCAGRQPWQSVVMLSNYTREPARSSALNLGAEAVYDKGFEMEAFLAWCQDQAARIAHGRTARPTQAESRTVR